MPKQVQLRRAGTGAHAVFTGAQGEVTVDTDKKVAVVHDGSTPGGHPLMKDADGVKKANNLSDVTRETARENLDVPWGNRVLGLVNQRGPVRGLWFSGRTSPAEWIAGTTGTLLALGTNDFSVEFVFTLRDYTHTSQQNLFYTHNAGNNRLSVQITTSGSFVLVFIDASGVVTSYTLAPDVALVDGETYHVVISCDRDGNAVLYVNGLSDRDKSGGGVSVSIAAAAGINIGDSNTTAYIFGHNAHALTFHAFRIYNYALSAGQAKALADFGDCLLEHQWGALSALEYASDFSVGADGWSGVSGSTVTGNVDGINSENDWLKIERTDPSAGRIDPSRLVLDAKGWIGVGEARRVKMRIYNPAGSPITHVRFTVSGALQCIPAAVAVPAGAATEVDFTWVSTGNFAGTFYKVEPALADGSFVASVANGTVFYVKDFTVRKLGCVLDLDCTEADPQQSTVLRDRSASGNHGTIPATGVYQLRRVGQFNAQSLSVGGSAVLKKLLTATASLNFPSIGAQGHQDLTITVNGAAVGDGVALGVPSAPVAGVGYFAFVSAANTVTVRACNYTGGAIDPGAATFRATVFQF